MSFSPCPICLLTSFFFSLLTSAFSLPPSIATCCPQGEPKARIPYDQLVPADYMEPPIFSARIPEMKRTNHASLPHLSTPGALLEFNGNHVAVPLNPRKTQLPTCPRTTTSKLLCMVSGSEATQRWWITKKKSEPYGFHIQQNKQNYSIGVGSRNQGAVCLAQSPGLVAPSVGWAPSLSSHPQLLQTVPAVPACWPSLLRSLPAMLLQLTFQCFIEFLYSLLWRSWRWFSFFSSFTQLCTSADRNTVPLMAVWQLQEPLGGEWG